MLDLLTSEIMEFQHFHFMRPFWLLALLPFIFIFKMFSQRDDNLSFWHKSMSKEILENLTIKGTQHKLLSPRYVMVPAAFVACILLAGPTWKQQPSPFTEDKSALIIALDVSETMNQSDVQPSRLLRAKQKIIELLKVRGDANTALIAYSGSAHTVMPISSDGEMIRHFLDTLDSTLMPKSGKLPQAVLPLAEDLLQATQVPGTLLIIGDGATAETVIQFSQFFKIQPHQLIVWAIGDSNFENLSAEKQSLIIPMQLDQLERLTEESSGRLVLMTHDKQDISLVNRYIENNLVIVEDASRPWFDAGYYLVFIFGSIFLLWFRRGWTLQW